MVDSESATKENYERIIHTPKDVGDKTYRVIKNRTENAHLGLVSGYGPLDMDMIPLGSSDFVTVLGYASNWKTGLMNLFASNNTDEIVAKKRNGHIVVTFTWEQAVEEQGVNEVARNTYIPTTDIMRGKLDKETLQLVEKSLNNRRNRPWWVVGHSMLDEHGRPRMTMEDVRGVLRYITEELGFIIDLGIFDYIQRIKRLRGGDMREGFIDIVDDIKDIPFSFHFPVIAGAQAKREVQSRDWALPQMEDCGETNNIEQSSDKMIAVWMPKHLYEEGYIIPKFKRYFKVTPNLLIMGLIKQRFGPAPFIYNCRVDPAKGTLVYQEDTTKAEYEEWVKTRKKQKQAERYSK